MIGLRNNAAKIREHRTQERLRATHVRRFARRMQAELNRVAIDASDNQGTVQAAVHAHERRVRAMLTIEYGEIFTSFGGRVLVQLGRIKPKGHDPELEYKATVRDEYAAAVSAFTQRWAGRRASEISKTTAKKIERVVREGTLNNWSDAEVADEIRLRVGKSMGARRALLIARTEVHAASQDAAFEMAQASGVDLVKEWVAVQDDRTREDHAEASGQVVAMHERFQVGDDELMVPGDPSAPIEQTANCRCIVVFNPV